MSDENYRAGRSGIANVIKEREEGRSVSEDIRLVSCSTEEVADFGVVPVRQNAAVWNVFG